MPASVRTKQKRVIPGFGVSFGVTITMIGMIVFLPISGLFAALGHIRAKELMYVFTSKEVLSAFGVSVQTALIAAVINCIFGLLIAWVFVRYDFTGKKILDGLIELPFALPTAVAGIALTSLYSNQGILGKSLEQIGIKVAYTKVGITIAMIFVGIPFVVRSIQPVLEKLDESYEEAAMTLGAGSYRIFLKVIFPEVFPAMLTGFGLAFARGIGEYGSVIFIAGNIPYKTQIVPLIIMSKLEQFQYNEATIIACMLLFISVLFLLFNYSLQQFMHKRTKN